MTRVGIAEATACTQAFIDENPVDIVIHRAPVEKTSAGGMRKGAAVDLPPIVGRMVSQSRNPQVRETADGRTVSLAYVLVTFPDSDVQKLDTFEYKGRTYEVVGVSDDPTWSLNAEVAEHGG